MILQFVGNERYLVFWQKGYNISSALLYSFKSFWKTDVWRIVIWKLFAPELFHWRGRDFRIWKSCWLAAARVPPTPWPQNSCETPPTLIPLCSLFRHEVVKGPTSSASIGIAVGVAQPCGSGTRPNSWLNHCRSPPVGQDLPLHCSSGECCAEQQSLWDSVSWSQGVLSLHPDLLMFPGSLPGFVSKWDMNCFFRAFVVDLKQSASEACWRLHWVKDPAF